MPRKSSFVAGALFANAVPHLASAVTGRRHMTPFGRESSSAVNAVWAAANAVGGCLLARRGMSEPGEHGATGWDSRLHALEAGALAVSAWMFASERLMMVNTSHAADRPS